MQFQFLFNFVIISAMQVAFLRPSNCVVRPDDDPTFPEAQLKLLSNPISTNSLEKFTGCVCPKSSPARKMRFYCGHEIRPGPDKDDVCHPDGIYRCTNPNAFAVMKENCDHDHKFPKCAKADCINMAKCFIMKEKSCEINREFFSHRQTNSHGVVDEPVVN